MAFRSGEFSVPGASYRPVPQAVACFDDKVWLIGTDNNGWMMQTTLALKQGGLDGPWTKDLESANWSTTAVDIQVPPFGRPVTGSRCAATPLGDALYLFWTNGPVDKVCTLMASRNTGPWESALPLQDTHGATIRPTVFGIAIEHPVFTSDVAATPFGDDTIIVASPSVLYTEHNSDLSVYIGAFNINDFNDQNTSWQARSETWIRLEDLQAWAPWIDGLGRELQISVDWFTSSAGPEGSPPYWLWVTLSGDWNSGIAPGGRSTFLVPLDHNGNPSGTLTQVYSEGERFGCFVVRDPAGRMRGYFNRWQDSELVTTTYLTYDAIQTLDMGRSPLPGVDVSCVAADDASTPSVAFFTDMNDKESITFNGQTGARYPVYEFIFYPASSVMCQVNLIGYADVLPNYTTLNPARPTVENMFIVGGIIDGPIPIPNENIVNYEFQSTQPNLGIVSYGSTQSQSDGHSTSNAWTVGFQSAGESLKGFGPAWNIAMNSGSGFTSGTVATTATSIQEQQLAVVLKNPNTLIPSGQVFCTEATIHATAYRFLDPDLNPVTDGASKSAGNQSPPFVSMWTTFSQPVAATYTPYAVTPGNLNSYTPEALNARMKSLGYDDKDGGYFEKVIVPHAYEFASNQNYLDFSWTRTGDVTPGFEATSSAFTEQSWTFSSSVYGGVSGGEGASIFGFGEDETFSFLAGGTFSHTANDTKTTANGWGIALTAGTEGRVGPPAAPDSDKAAMTEYRFRIYFLPPPAPPSKLPRNYWVTELQAHLQGASFDPKQIDPNASAWKIMYVVTEYKSQEQSYIYTGPFSG